MIENINRSHILCVSSSVSFLDSDTVSYDVFQNNPQYSIISTLASVLLYNFSLLFMIKQNEHTGHFLFEPRIIKKLEIQRDKSKLLKLINFFGIIPLIGIIY